MILITNPWNTLEKSTMRRVNSKDNVDIYWYKTISEDYSLYFKVNSIFKNFPKIEMEHIIINSSNDELIIILKDTAIWEIFKTFCDDLIYNLKGIKEVNEISSTLIKRINNWKNLFIKKRKKEMPLEVQMGLFSELSTLKNIILKNRGSIEYWRGPEKDTQDFLCNNCSIEVKSTLTSQKKNIIISSINQLESEKNNLFLNFYSLSKVENGKNIKVLTEEIMELLSTDDKTKFMTKLFKLDYDLTEENYMKFLVDNIEFYNAKDKNFPKLNSDLIKLGIIEIKYKIDLNLCTQFKMNLEQILEEI